MFDDNQNILSFEANGLENPTSQIHLGLASKLEENESFPSSTFFKTCMLDLLMPPYCLSLELPRV